MAPFSDSSLRRRSRLFRLLGELMQRLLTAGIPCDMFVDGSFLTVKPEPSDVDVIVRADRDAYEALDGNQVQVFEAINTDLIDGAGQFCGGLVP